MKRLVAVLVAVMSGVVGARSSSAQAGLEARSGFNVFQTPGEAGPGDDYSLLLEWGTHARNWISCTFRVELMAGSMRGSSVRETTIVAQGSFQQVVLECVAGKGSGDSLRVEMRVLCRDGSVDVIVRRGWFRYGRRVMVDEFPHFALVQCEKHLGGRCWRYTNYSEMVPCGDGGPVSPEKAWQGVVAGGVRSISVRGSIPERLCGISLMLLVDEHAQVTQVRALGIPSQYRAILDSLCVGRKVRGIQVDRVGIADWAPGQLVCK